MVTSGPGIFFDGTTSTRHDVSVELERGRAACAPPRAICWRRWPYGELEHLSRP